MVIAQVMQFERGTFTAVLAIVASSARTAARTSWDRSSVRSTRCVVQVLEHVVIVAIVVMRPYLKGKSCSPTLSPGLRGDHDNYDMVFRVFQDF
jgi:hypothetical protein